MDSLLGRTDINTQDRQESAGGVVSAVTACQCLSLHNFHQISFGYGQTILLYAQARKREQYMVARRSS